jgi:hypothetical protein
MHSIKQNRVKYFLDSFPENEIVLQKIDEMTGEFNQTYVIVKGFESHVVRKVQELYNYAVEVPMLALACAQARLQRSFLRACARLLGPVVCQSGLSRVPH